MNHLFEILREVPAASRPEKVFDAELISTLDSRIGDRLTTWALGIAHESALEILTDVAPSRRQIFGEIIEANTESISLDLLRYLHGVPGATVPRVGRAQRESITHGVRESIDQARQTRGIRVLERHWKRAFTGLILERFAGTDALGVLNATDDRLATYFDTLIDQNARFFADEQQRLREKQLIGQRTLVDRIIAGLPVDDALVSEVLGTTPHDVHHGFIVESGSAAGHTAPTLDVALFRHAFEQRFRDRLVTVIPDTGERSWIFVSGRPLHSDEVESRIHEVMLAVPGGIVSAGIPGVGTEGIRRAHLSALAAHHLNAVSSGAGPIVSFEKQGLLCLAIANTELARWFVTTEIGPLLADTPFNEELRTTLLKLLEHQGAQVKTAEALYVHRNTISHRLKRLEELLGRDPLARPLETHAALLLARFVPPK